MKIAIRCIYRLTVRPNFLIIDLPEVQWKIFLGGSQKDRIEMIQPYISYPGPSSTNIKEISWIPLQGLNKYQQLALIGACL